MPESDLHEHHRFTVSKGQESIRIDKFLLNKIENISRNKIQNAAKADYILVDGVAVKSNYKIKPGNVISVVMADPPRSYTLEAENIPLNIIYEDEAIVIVNKPVGLVVHPGVGNHTGTLMHGLLYHFQMNPPPTPPRRGVKKIDAPPRRGVKRIDAPPRRGVRVKPELVHRIDKDTSGLLVIAKNEYAMTYLAKQFFEHTVERIYVALVWGDFDQDKGTITGHIGRDLRYRKRMDVFPDGDHGKEAITHYKVLERFGYVTLVECKLETGRTHQIRAHMKFIKHPIFNDKTYKGNKIAKGMVYSKYKQFVEECFQLMSRQALHAKTLAFIHPLSNKHVSFESELPEDFKNVVEKWREYCN